MPTQADVRRLALALPETTEEPHFDLGSFRVNRKIFCTMAADSPRIMLKLDPEDQRNLVADNPAAIQPVPGYWGQKGSTHIQLGQLDEARLASLMRLAWATVAPKRLLR
ncbi:MmcQ/YjbR family DNA-binding protein [Phenylobacterium sp.]|jgi:hypothetical protein|uniref:MmcQ/YjbR family DNA-binding protein n=1 Tax=Phenylobacterium sp. TaxID=1871053 RepID=UPI002E2EF715|nr:MmcQ/YjbR family DNA-binding protein [Phenylobacterium sp.]HEX4711855.1 MmcQ/YjbR family DNA-binding protein [Phenylobacterium sp.]